MVSEELYKKYAKYYDKIYDDKDYKKESEFISWAVEHHKTCKGNKLLDVACGTGEHAKYLVDSYSILGIDISPEMLKLARKKVPGAEFKIGDMKTLALNQKFDIILCMFAAIAYNVTYNELNNTLKLFHDHLEPGGVLLFDLHIHEDYFLGGKVWVNTVVDIENDLQLARIAPSPLKKEILDLTLIFFVKDKGKLDFSIDQHQMGLFNVDRIRRLMTKLGYETTLYAGFSKKRWNKKLKSPVVVVGVK